jgi:hypothetical protein
VSIVIPVKLCHQITPVLLPSLSTIVIYTFVCLNRYDHSQNHCDKAKRIFSAEGIGYSVTQHRAFRDKNSNDSYEQSSL